MQRVRLFVSMGLAVGITLALFAFMQYLIAGTPGMGEKSDNLGGIRFGPIKLDEELRVRERKIPKKPPPPKDPPPPPKLNIQNIERIQTPMPMLNMPKLDVPMSGSGPFLGAFASMDQNAEGDVIPLVRIQPQYPRRAAIAKIEGFVTIEFTITVTGSVTDPKVVAAKPPRVFDRDAIRAILKWKFKPRVIDGKPVPRRAIQTLDFKLVDF